jgi:hypothetical protein
MRVNAKRDSYEYRLIHDSDGDAVVYRLIAQGSGKAGPWFVEPLTGPIPAEVRQAIQKEASRPRQSRWSVHRLDRQRACRGDKTPGQRPLRRNCCPCRDTSCKFDSSRLRPAPTPHAGCHETLPGRAHKAVDFSRSTVVLIKGAATA